MNDDEINLFASGGAAAQFVGRLLTGDKDVASLERPRHPRLADLRLL
jgi:hypothetical protein